MIRLDEKQYRAVKKMTRAACANNDCGRATKLNPVWLHPVLENAIRENGDEIALPAFNCFS